MKLFAYACLAGSGSAQSGDYDDRVITSDYYESTSVDRNDYYEYDEFGNKKNKKKNKWFDQDQKFGLEVYDDTTVVFPSTNYWDWATALNCWPANIEADQLVYANQLLSGTQHRQEAGLDATANINPDLFPTQKFFMKAPQHVYGSYEILDRAHDASNTDPQDPDINSADSDNPESNTITRHIKNGYFAGYGEHAGATDNMNLHQEDPVLRSGLGGLYQYGHDTWNAAGTNEYHNADMDYNKKTNQLTGESTYDDTTAIRWTHYKQARHAGCLYEKAEWHYGYATYEQIFLATYFQGYGSFNLETADTTDNAWVPAFDTQVLTTPTTDYRLFDDIYGANIVEPIWWHFFNAHILPNPQHTDCAVTDAHAYEYSANLNGKTSYACPTVPVGTLLPSPWTNTGGTTATSADFIQPQTSNAIPLVMANPAYEGLGYLNFIVEYKNKGKDVGEDYLEFIDSTPSMSGAGHSGYDGSSGTTAGFRNLNTYREINNCNATANTGVDATSGNFSNGNANNSMAAEQECTGWGENLGNWTGVHGMNYYDLYMGSWLVYPAIGSHQGVTSNDAFEHYRTWVLYPFTTDNIPVIFDVGDHTKNFTAGTGTDAAIAKWQMSTFEMNQAAGGASTVDWSQNHDLVVSSFPHNNLGKDFRFNLRVLQGALTSTAITGTSSNWATQAFFYEAKSPANQIYRSYYFYKINQIDIRFPYYVAYALHHENRGMEGDAARAATELRTYDGTADTLSGTAFVDGRTLAGTNSNTGDWGGDAANWGAAPGDLTGVVEWCDNDVQCAPMGQQWWNTLNNDIIHPLVYDGTGTTAELYRAMDTDITDSTNIAHNRNEILAISELDDYQFMHVSAAHLRSNIIPPIDLGTHSPGVNKHGAYNNDNNTNVGGAVEFHRVMGFIRRPTSWGSASNQSALVGPTGDGHTYHSADWCDHTGGAGTAGTPETFPADSLMGENILERTCGVDFRIIGLMNTYDERRGQRGTYQEIWVQLQYALGKGARDGHFSPCEKTGDDTATVKNQNGDVDCTVANHPIQSPHPYLHFMASEIISIQAYCNTTNVNNPNRCSTMILGPGESNNAAYGGK
jgi:hypothetical protein